MLKHLLDTPKPTVRADLAPIMPAIVAARRAVTDYHDALLVHQGEESRENAARMEQAQQTVGALVRELGNLLEKAREIQRIGDQLDRVHDELRLPAAG